MAVSGIRGLRDYFDLAPSFRTIARWIRYFADGRESVEDEARAGRPSTFVTDSSVKRAEALIGEDPTNTKISRLGTWGKLRRCTHG
jgi:hypothetical protein